MRARWLLLLILILMLVLASASCRKKPMPHDTLMRMDAEAAASSASIVFDVGTSPWVLSKKPEALPVAIMKTAATTTTEEGLSFLKKALPIGTRLGRGDVMLPGVANPDRLVIATPDKRGVLVDARSGKTLVSLPVAPLAVSPKGNVVSLADKTARVLRLDDAQIITPVIDSAAGHVLVKSNVLAGPRHDFALALAKTEDGKHLYGVSTDRLATFALHPFPFSVTADSAAAMTSSLGWEVELQQRAGAGGGGHQAGTPSNWKHSATCIKARVSHDGAATCLEFEPYSSSPGGLRWMGDGWIAGESFVTHESWPDQKKIAWSDVIEKSATTTTDTRHCLTRSTHDVPPRIVGMCLGTTTAFVWSPGAVWSFLGPSGKVSGDLGGLSGASSGPVLPILEPRQDATREEERVKRWVDTTGLRVVEGPEMFPLKVAAFAGVPHRTLVQENQPKPGAPATVMVIDFTEGTRTSIATNVTDCPGMLHELGDSESASTLRWAVLACEVQPKKDIFVFNLVWAEIVDLEKHVRWRTSLMPLTIFDDGLAIFSSQLKTAVESKTGAGEITSVDLAAAAASLTTARQ